MRSQLNRALGTAFTALPALFVSSFLSAQEQTVSGERIPAHAISPLVRETMDQVMERDRTMPKDTTVRGIWNGEDGRWFVPTGSAKAPVHSGLISIVNEWGDPRMGIGFGRSVDLIDVWAAGHGASPARAVRFVGLRGTTVVKQTEWIALGADMQRVALDFAGVDRLEVHAAPTVGRMAFVALDDLRFAPAGQPNAVTTLDFEDLGFKHVLSGTNYAGLSWESGRGLRGVVENGDIVPAPKTVVPSEPPVEPEQMQGIQGGPGATPPTVWADFAGTTQGDPGANLIPPDTHGCSGPNHYLSITNSNISVWTKSTQARVVNSSLTAFYPGATGTVGDPRAIYDPHSGRYIAMATNFTGGSIYIAVSATNDPTGAWFKFSFAPGQGTDAGRWSDYPTLGVDRRGIYLSGYMVGSTAIMTIWALDKAPLIAATPSVGTITAFRSLPYEQCIQPCVTYGDPGVEYFISRVASNQLRLRRVNPPLTAPTLTTVATVTVASHATAPSAPALGSTTGISTVDTRMMNAVFRNGSIYGIHNIGVTVGSSLQAACRWYQVSTTGTLQQTGTLVDPLWHYYYGAIAVDRNGDVGIGCSGSHANAYCSTFISGRRAGDPAGITTTPRLIAAGAGPWNRLDGSGRNRFGDYAIIDVDIVDDMGFWTNQEYIPSNNVWRTRVTRFGYESSNYGIGLAGSTGVPALTTTNRPVLSSTVNIRVGSSNTVAAAGALAFGTARASTPLFGGTLLVNPVVVLTFGVPAAGLTIGLPLSNDVALINLPLYFQSAIGDAAAPQGLALSEGLEIRAGSR